MQADERLRIDTPEQMTLELSLAGVGSRFLAVAVDTVLQIAIGLAGIVLLGLLPAASRLALVAQLGPAVTVLFLFCVYWGYFAFFEILWSGQTPGKRVAGIRVIKDSGRAINGYEAIGRNVMRAIDFLPAMYAIGVLVMLVNRESRRLGDFVAGTVVVHDRPSGDARPEWAAEAGGAAPRTAMAQLTPEDLVLVETYLQRRGDLDPLVRDRMAGQIAQWILERTGVSPEAGSSLDDFLQSVARRVRETARFR